MPLVIAAADIVQQLRRRFGIRGTTDLQLQENIVPVVNLGDVDSPPWHAKEGATGSISIGPVAAQFPHVGIQWPITAGKNSVLVVKRLYHGFSTVVGNGSQVRIGIASVATLTAVGALPSFGAPTRSWDSKEDGTALVDEIFSPAAIGGTNSNSNAIGEKDSLLVPQGAGVLNLTEGPWVLRRGQILLITGQQLNTGLQVGFYADIYQGE